MTKSKITYNVSHPLHDCEGESRTLSGKISCHDESCEVNLQTPIKSFVSHDPKKDIEMNEITKSEKFPDVKLTGQAKINDKKVRLISPALFIAGVSYNSEDIELELNSEWGKAQVSGEISFSLDKYGIRKPKLMNIPIGDKVTVSLEVIVEK